MAGKSRGAALTVLALLFGLLAISNFLKPFHLDPNAGFVFAGTKLTGTGNAIMGPLFGALLVIYAYGIWTMRRWALPASYVFAGWVIGNMIMFTLKHRGAPHPSLVFAIVTVAIGVGVPIAAAIVLSRRSADLG
ncbi:MAG: hypothetical protein ACREQH_14085 [Candidatus Binatus sp.]